MDNKNTTPIGLRLQEFINKHNMSPSAFADMCKLSRSNLSQTLSGRNQTVNNIFLSRIKDAFPDLDVSWLLFGLPQVKDNANIEISEPQNRPNNAESALQTPETQRSEKLYDTYPPLSEIDEESNDDTAEYESAAADSNSYPIGCAGKSPRSKKPKNPQAYDEESEDADSSSSKTITKIVVLYSDNTFETFSPA